jgi:hypothetical protein
MRWTPLDRYGQLVIVDGPRVHFSTDERHTAPSEAVATPYAPVVARDAGVTLLLYRGHEDDSVRVLANTGWAATLQPGSVPDKWAKGCDGKWPLGIAIVGHRKFRATWLKPGTEDRVLAPRKRRGVADLDFNDPKMPLITYLPDAPVTEDSPLVLLDFDGERCEYEVEGADPRTVERGGVSMKLGYSQVVNGRVVGHDASSSANRIILADHDGIFVVCEGDAAVQFPARLDVMGNVACFEGQFFLYADIRTRPIVIVKPELPPEVPEPPTADENADRVLLSACRQEVAQLQATLDAVRALLPKEPVYTKAEVRSLVAAAVGRLPRWQKSLGVPPSVRAAVDAELAATS